MIKVDLKLPDSKIYYFPKFLDARTADSYFKILKDTLHWRQDTIKLFGKEYATPRLSALYGINGKPYTYSNNTMLPHLFTKELSELNTRIKKLTKINFTTCLANLYRDGSDSNGWHADDEKELGENPIIASVTLGQERFFHLKHRHDKTLKHKILLEHGSLLLMQGETQHNWLHQIPKTKRAIGERINLTFRIIK